jgi:hypothetical protein
MLLGVSADAQSFKGKLEVPEAGRTQMLTLDDGSTLVGRITEVGDAEIKFQTDLGEMTISIGKIREIKEISASAIKGGQYWFTNPNRTRMFIGPTGRTLRKGEGYFADIYLFFPGVAYGLTDNITIGGGMSIFPGLDFGEQLFYVTPKIGFPLAEKVDLAASLMLFRIPDVDDDDAPQTVGVVFGTMSLGTDDASLTGGVGFGMVDGDMADRPAVTIGGEYRLARRASLVTENWILPGVDDPLISFGVRFFGESIAVDLALFNVLNEDAIFPGIPYVDFVWNF